MKTILIIGCFVVFALSSCGQRQLNSEKPTEEEVKKVKEIALPIISTLITSLQSELMSEMQKGGPLSAIEVCNMRALPITDAAAKGSGRKVEVKRVSRNFRNPKNAPDAIDERALGQFEAVIASGQNWPEFLVNKVQSVSGTDYYFYKPLKVAPLCLNCHGDTGTMDKNLVNKIKSLYPRDKAVGYKDGDFRGLVRIKISEL